MELTPEQLDAINAQIGSAGAELEPVPDGGPGVYWLSVGPAIQSELNLADPTDLGVPYVCLIDDVILDVIDEDDEARILHLGTGAASLARALAVERPLAFHMLVDSSPEICEPLLRAAPLPEGFRGQFVFDDARHALQEGPVRAGGPYDIAVIDLWTADRVGPGVSTREFYHEVADVLHGHGVLVVNVPASGACEFARAQAAALRSQFAEVAVAVERDVLADGEPGNAVIFATLSEDDDRGDGVEQWAGSDDDFQGLHGADLDVWIGDVPAADDTNAAWSPPLS